MPELISIVIPTYGRADMLSRALQSVTAQTDTDFEIIVVDDGSPADEARSIANLVAKTPKCRLLINETNRGAPFSRNRAVENATGTIIATLDSDDWWESERLAKHRAAHQQNAISLSYNPTLMVGLGADGREKLVCNEPPVFPDNLRLSGALWNFLGGCSSVCFNRDRFLAVGGFNEGLLSCQDWDLWYRMGLDGGGVIFVSDTLTHQDWGLHERISTTRTKVDEGHKQLFNLIRSSNWSPQEFRLIRAHHERVKARIDKDFGKPFGAVLKAIKSFLIRPSRWALGDIASYGREFLRTFSGPKT